MRPATLLRLGVGGACLLEPRRVLAVVGGADREDPTTHLVARVLGGRLVLQACADLLLGQRIRGVGVLVDLTHAASMLPVAACWPAHRRTALTSATVATSFAVLDARPGHLGSSA
jgi:hypothetical protein